MKPSQMYISHGDTEDEEELNSDAKPKVQKQKELSYKVYCSITFPTLTSLVSYNLTK